MTRKRDTEDRNGEGRFAYDGLDRVLHEKARLGILTSLVAHPEGLKFGELRGLCSLTDGNLSRHLDVLRDAVLRRNDFLSPKMTPQEVEDVVAYLNATYYRFSQ